MPKQFPSQAAAVDHLLKKFPVRFNFRPLPEKDAAFAIIERERKNLTHTHYGCTWRVRKDGLVEHRCIENSQVFVINKKGRRCKGIRIEAFK